MKEKTKVALIGVGYWGPNILRNLRENNNFDLEYVVDLSEERRNYVIDNYDNIKVTSDISNIMDDAAVDAVVIATPARTHFELTMMALNKGKHVLVEKPMAISTKEIDKIHMLSQEKNLVAMVGHTFLYNSAVRHIKRVIDSGEIGDIRYIYSQRTGLGRVRSDIDALWNFAPHDISIIHYWLDNPKPLYKAKHGQDYLQEGIDDTVFLNIKYPNKILVSVHVSWLAPIKTRRMTIVGSKKMIVYDDILEDKVCIYDKGVEPKAVIGKNMDFDSGVLDDFVYRDHKAQIPNIEWKEPLKVEIAHFLDCIKNNSECLTDTIHARGVVEVLSF